MSNLTLPDVIPIFPLTGAVLLPGCSLPLNIFEPRYLAMVRDAVDSHQIVGMIQPAIPGDTSQKPETYSVGCAGRIARLSETDDGRLLINLEALCRFRIETELAVTTPYRQVNVDWSPFIGDLLDHPDPQMVDRARLMMVLETYLERRDLEADLEAIDEAPDDALVNSLAMILPLSPAEKQALLEVPGLESRASTLISCLEMDGHDQGDPNSPSALN